MSNLTRSLLTWLRSANINMMTNTLLLIFGHKPNLLQKTAPAILLLSAITIIPNNTEANPQCDATVAAGGSIQSALDGMESGDVLCVAAGTFTEDLVIETSHVTLVAADNGNPPLIQGSSVAILISQADSVRIQGLEIRGATRGIRLENSDGVQIVDNKITENDWGIHDATGSVHALVSGNTVTDNSIRGIHLASSEYAIVADNVVRNNAKSASGIGMGMNISGHSTITGNLFEDNADQAIRAEGSNLLIENNTFTGHRTAIDLLRTTRNRADDARVVNNTFTGNDTGLNVQSSRVEVDGNTFSGNIVDLQLSVAQNATITDNEMETGLSLDLSAATVTHDFYFDHQMSGNTVDGRPLFFARETESPSIPDNAAQIFLYQVDDAVISDMTFDGLAAGIMVGYCNGIEITGNSLDSVGGQAIGVWESANILIENNTVTNSGHVSNLQGINVVDSPGTVIDNNVVTGNARNGIYLTRSSNTVIENNIASENGQNGIFSTTQSHNVTTRNNTVENNGQVGIRYFGGGENGEISGNTVSGNGDAGIQDGMNRNNQGTTISNNVVTDNEREGIDFRSRDAVITGNTVSGNGGLFGAITSGSDSFVAGNTVTDNNLAGIRAGHGSTVRNNTITGNTHNGIEFRISNNSTAIGNEVRDNNGVGISISRSNNAVVDSNTVTGHNADLFIFDQSENALVRHNSFESGVILDSFNAEFDELNHTFVNNTLREDRPLFFARGENNPEIPEDAGQIILVSSSNVDISGFDFVDVAAGVQIVYSQDVRIAGNNFSSNHGEGFSARRAPVSVWGTNDLTVENNTIINTDGYSIQVYRSPEAIVSGNESVGNYSGFLVSWSPHASIRHNTVSESEFRGLEIVRSDSIHAFGNNFSDNLWEGILVENSFMVLLDSNTVSDNARQGMFFESSDNATIRGNTVTNNGGTGIESHFGFRSSDEATITDNTVTGNGQHGINFPAEGAFVGGNNVRNNDDIGIIIGSRTVVEENRIVANSGHGLQVNDDGGDVIIAYNSIRDNGGVGLSYTRNQPLMAINNWWGHASGPSGGAEDPETGTAADGSGNAVSSDVRFDPWLTEDPFGETETSTDEADQLPVTFALDQNYPNPFNPSTQIRYHLPVDADVRLAVYTILGERVATLVNARQQAGSHAISFDATKLSSGVYIYRIDAGEHTQTSKMMLVR